MRRGKPVIEAKCLRCGLCCWDWRGELAKEAARLGGRALHQTTAEAAGRGSPALQTDRCEHLRDDMRTCLIHDRLAEVRPECVEFPHPEQAVDLPDECGYKRAWRAAGVI